MSKYSTSRQGPQPISSRTDKRLVPLERLDSTVTKLCDLHVYKVPADLWRENFNNILNNVVTETISIGIIRVPSETRLSDLRDEIIQQLQPDDMGPRDWVFLRSVGRSLTRLRTKQEYQLKAKHFLPPVSFAPELYILEATPEVRDALAISERGSSQSPPLSRRASPSHRGYSNSYRNGYNGKSDIDKSQKPFRDSSPPVNKYHPLPHIDPAFSSLDRAHHNKSAHSQTHIPNFDPPDPDRHTHNPPDTFSHKYGANQYRNSPPSQTHKDLVTEDQRVPWAERAHRSYAPDTSEMPDWGEQWQQPQTVRPDVYTAVPAAAAAATGNTRGPWDSRGRHASPDKFGSTRDFNRRPDDDSGVAEMTPDDDYNNSGRGRRNHGNHTSRKDDYDMLAKRLESEQLGFGYDEDSREERRRRLEDLEGLSMMDRQRWDNDQDDRRRQAEEDRRREEDERRRREDEEKRRREEEEEKRRKEEENRLEEERRKRKEEEEELRKREEERMREETKSPDDDPSKRDTESARQRRREEKNQLLRELEDARQSRQEQEKEREELVKKAKALQHKTTNRRNDARDMWKKKYFEEKKKTAPLEENSNRLRQELEALHRRLMNTLEGPKEKNARLIDSNPSRKNNYIIQCTKLQHDIEDLQRRVANAKMKLTAEMKLRSQAQTELKAVRTEAMQNRLTLKLATGHARPARLAAGPPHPAELHTAAAAQ
ncbi:hypothetical protein RRG08_021704 [Elysia crispata]|uniref:Spermatogenesis-associated protein 1 C-terminal domain-containing protein n=1 Tax=Elysia crispata TaxID=231223 RepID=A0AAE1DNS7_9GAST|nr:hypothetical protein RRG08_021704 [Elysia crispata]